MKLIAGIQTKTLKIIPDERGRLFEILRRDEPLFRKFGQVYCTTVNYGVVKGWHYHKKQADNFVVVKGNAKVVLYDDRKDSQTKGELQEVFMGEDNPILLKIPTYVVHGITPVGDEPSYLINCPTLPYDYKSPDEFRISFKSKEIPYDWGLEEGG